MTLARVEARHLPICPTLDRIAFDSLSALHAAVNFSSIGPLEEGAIRQEYGSCLAVKPGDPRLMVTLPQRPSLDDEQCLLKPVADVFLPQSLVVALAMGSPGLFCTKPIDLDIHVVAPGISVLCRMGANEIVPA